MKIVHLKPYSDSEFIGCAETTRETLFLQREYQLQGRSRSFPPTAFWVISNDK